MNLNKSDKLIFEESLLEGVWIMISSVKSYKSREKDAAFQETEKTSVWNLTIEVVSEKFFEQTNTDLFKTILQTRNSQ